MCEAHITWPGNLTWMKDREGKVEIKCNQYSFGPWGPGIYLLQILVSFHSGIFFPKFLQEKGLISLNS